MQSIHCETKEMSRCLREARNKGIWNPGMETLNGLRFWRTPRGRLYATPSNIDVRDGSRRVEVEYERGAGYRATERNQTVLIPSSSGQRF